MRPAFKKMIDIIHGHYTGNWKTLTKVPQSKRDLWFREFEKVCYWNVSTVQMKKTFFHQAGKHIRNVFTGCRARNVRPSFLSSGQWAAIEKIRKTDPSSLRQSAANKKNRSCQNAIDAGNFHGGSRKFTKWINVVEKQTGVRPKISTMVQQLWSKPDGSWTGSRPALYVEKFDELVVSQSAPSCAENGDDPCPQPMSEVDEKALWIAACGGPKNHRIFAMGEEGVALIRNGKATDQHTKPQATSTTQTFQDAQIREEVREEIKQMQSTMMEFMQKHQQQQQDLMKQLQTDLF